MPPLPPYVAWPMVGQLGRVVLLSKTHETSLSHILTLSEPQGDLYNLTLGGYFMVVQGGFEAAPAASGHSRLI